MKKTSPGTRLQIGASVLAAARAIDTRLVRDRLQRFEQAHRSYVGAQRKVDTAEAQIEAAQRRVAGLETVHDEAIEDLARALVTDRQPRKTPFEAFGSANPGALMALPSGEKAVAVHQLVAAVLRTKTVSEAVTRAAEAVDKAASAVEEALGPMAKLQDTARDARRTRDAVGQTWEAAIAALRRVALAAGDEGAPDLYPTLFPKTTKAGSKPKPAAAPATESPPPAATPNAA
jgi:hypothetical protein